MAYADSDMDAKYSQVADVPDEKPPRARSRSPVRGRRGGNGGEPEAVLKILVPDVAGGALIGRKGAGFEEMKEKSGGGKFKISPSGQFYPGSNQERILLLMGTVEQVIELNILIMGKLDHERGINTERANTVKMIVPSQTAGVVIGKGGADIKDLMQSSGAKIIVNSSEKNSVKGERTITVIGDVNAVQTACATIIPRVSVEPRNLKENQSLHYDDRSSGMDGGRRESRDGPGANLNDILAPPPNLQALLNQAPAPMAPPPAPVAVTGNGFGGLDLTKIGGDVMRSIKKTVTVNIEVPERIASIILNSRENLLGECRQVSGAEIDFSRNDFNSRNSGRLLTIYGSLDQAQKAYEVVGQKINQVAY